MKLSNLKVQPKVEFVKESSLADDLGLKKLTFEVKGIVCGL